MRQLGHLGQLGQGTHSRGLFTSLSLFFQKLYPVLDVLVVLERIDERD